MFRDANGNTSLSKIFKAAALGTAVALGGLTAVQIPYVVDESERAMIKNFSQLQEGVVGPGLHFKMPWADSAVTFSLKPRQLDLLNQSTGTKDNQSIWADLTVIYRVNEEVMPQLIREPGWEDRIRTVAISRYKAVLGGEDVLKIPERRAAISLALTEQIAAAVKEEVGVTVTDVQFVNYEVDPELAKRIDEISRAKSDVEKAKQLRDQAAIDAETKEKVALGDANAVRAKADGDAYATKAAADAEAYTISAEGKAKADALTVQLTAVGDPSILVSLAQAAAWQEGGAQMPTTLVTGGDTTTLVAPAVDTATKVVASSAKPAASPKAPTP